MSVCFSAVDHQAWPQQTLEWTLERARKRKERIQILTKPSERASLSLDGSDGWTIDLFFINVILQLLVIILYLRPYIKAGDIFKNFTEKVRLRLYA